MSIHTDDLLEIARRVSYELPADTETILREFDTGKWFSISRYPTDVNGNRYDYPHFDVAHFAQSVERLLSALEGLYDELAAHLYEEILEWELPDNSPGPTA